MRQPSEQEYLEMLQISKQFNHFIAYLFKVRSDEFERTVGADPALVHVAQGRARLADDLVKQFERIRNGAK
jgi:hypothetical protein